MFKHLIVFTTITLLTGCTAYTAPGRGANLSELGITPEIQKAGTHADLNAAFDKKPLASFPANIAIARLQEPGYHSATAEGYGHGAYSIVITRDVESDQSMEKLSKL